MLVSACQSCIHFVHVMTNTRWQTCDRFYVALEGPWASDLAGPWASDSFRKYKKLEKKSYVELK